MNAWKSFGLDVHTDVDLGSEPRPALPIAARLWGMSLNLLPEPFQGATLGLSSLAASAAAATAAEGVFALCSSPIPCAHSRNARAATFSRESAGSSKEAERRLSFSFSWLTPVPVPRQLLRLPFASAMWSGSVVSL